MIVPAHHSPGPPCPPGPDHRGDIMKERQGLAASAKPVRHPPAEPRAVDRHDGIGALCADRCHRLAHAAQDDRGARQYLGHAHDRQIAERDEALQPLLPHALASDPGDSKPPVGALPQRRNQRAAQCIPRRLPGNKEDEGRVARCHHPPTPTRNSPARSAARITSSRSSTIVTLASTAIPRNPLSSANKIYRTPIVGRSARGSCPGFATLTSTP